MNSRLDIDPPEKESNPKSNDPVPHKSFKSINMNNTKILKLTMSIGAILFVIALIFYMMPEKDMTVKLTNDSDIVKLTPADKELAQAKRDFVDAHQAMKDALARQAEAKSKIEEDYKKRIEAINSELPPEYKGKHLDIANDDIVVQYDDTNTGAVNFQLNQ